MTEILTVILHEFTSNPFYYLKISPTNVFLSLFSLICAHYVVLSMKSWLNIRLKWQDFNSFWLFGRFIRCGTMQMCQMKWKHEQGVCPLQRRSSVLIPAHVKDTGWYILLLSVCLNFPRCGADKGGRAADKRCVVAAVEIWTTILIVIACRPTFPVGAIMAIACTVRVQRERRLVRAESRQPRADLLPFSIFGCESMKSESAGAAMATAAHE